MRDQPLIMPTHLMRRCSLSTYMEQLVRFPVAGTTESNALIFSNRLDDDLSCLHSFGIHSVPHIGVYGPNYPIALPLVLLSLKPTIDILSQVPSDALAALDINLQAINESLLRQTARDLVSKVLASAAKCVNSYFAWRGHQQLAQVPADSAFDKDIPTTPDCCIHDTTSLPSDCIDVRSDTDDCDSKNDITDYDEEQVLRKIAQKLVRKVLHLACTMIEPVNRTSSIEELLTVTKKLKITVSPSYTPPLQIEESQLQQDPPDLLNFKFDETPGHACVDGVMPPSNSCFSVGSQMLQQVPHKCLGKKRQRSASHEANMELDMEKIRLKFQTKLQLIDENHIKHGHANGHSEKALVEENMVPTTFTNSRSVASMVSNIKQMSIMEVEKESDDNTEEDEEDTILEAVTKPLPIIPDEQIYDNCHEKDIFCVGVSASHDVRNSPEKATCSVLFNNQSQSAISQSFILPDLDYYIIVHGFPPPSECQKFLCNNMNEVNLMFHCWLFKDMPFDPAISVIDKMEMGIFEPQGVLPVHLDLADSGVPFYYLESRTVCIHDLCFSPENAQLQLSPTSSKFRSFYSVGSYQNRRVLTFHILPSTKTVENELSLILQQCDGSFSEFLETIHLQFSDLASSLTQHLI